MRVRSAAVDKRQHDPKMATLIVIANKLVSCTGFDGNSRTFVQNFSLFLAISAT